MVGGLYFMRLPIYLALERILTAAGEVKRSSSDGWCTLM